MEAEMRLSLQLPTDRVSRGAELGNDPKLLDRLIAACERKYPREIADWRDRFRKGFADGSRVLIRYAPA